MENNQQNNENKEEPRYKKIIRKTKKFIKENWEILLIITLLISSVELLYFDEQQKSIIQSGGENFIQATGREAKSGLKSVALAPVKLGKGVFRGVKGLPNVGKKILNTNILTKILHGLWLVVKNLLTLLMFVFIFMAIPLIPILVFMLIMFFILRGQIGNLKQL